MEKAKVGWSWGAAAAVLVVILGVLAFFLWYSPPAKGEMGQTPSPPPKGPTSTEGLPPAIVQWQSGTVLESMLAAKILADNRDIKNGLQALAKNPGMTREEMLKYVGHTYYKNPRLWTDSGWVEGWEEVLPRLKMIVAGSDTISIDTVSAHIEYQPYLGARTPAEDIDAVAKIIFTFTANAEDPPSGGGLKHSRICEWN
ncbi:MAG TPA: hypothetical protein ENO03_07095 [Candidatus Aminicenantes bacterium]|nr:hypothetical protein [Candidatus Aminicenantes bacterium]HDT14107.1 hypothetical protein [Candidatus Aminicenantes bacterium]